MRCALDLDGTIDSAPQQFQSIMSALQAAGHTVIVVTGTGDSPVTPEDWQQKANYLTSLGCGQCWDQLVVLPNPPGSDLHDAKAQWLADNDVHVLVDNTKVNARAATQIGIPLVLVPWASRQ